MLKNYEFWMSKSKFVQIEQNDWEKNAKMTKLTKRLAMKH